MSIFKEFKNGFKKGQEKAKNESIRNKASSTTRVIVFEENGDINVATLIDPHKLVGKENLINFKPCPQEVIDTIPPAIVEMCKLSLPHYLYFVKCDDGKVRWESTCDIN